jgi:Golgi nucleoside diphosphatase
MPLLQWVAQFLLCCGLAAAGDIYGLVADAGSTGTRVYLFHLPLGHRNVKITDLGKGEALSSFKDNPEGAYEASIGPQLAKGAQMLPEDFHGNVSVSVFATAGMRLLEKETQDRIYDALRTGFKSAALPFTGNTFEAKTISGRQEGTYAMLAANYLAGSVDEYLIARSPNMLGVLDLGGSSTQVAVPPHKVEAGMSVLPTLRDAHVKSFLSLGMERMRQKTWKKIVGDEASGPNPCAFPGYTEEKWKGVGEAGVCEAHLKEVFKTEKASCDRTQTHVTDCLDDAPVPLPERPHFYLISGYMYVTNFTSWVMENLQEEHLPLAHPTIEDFREAAKHVCSTPWEKVQSWGRHAFTPDHKTAHRCFEINYIVALLSYGYGFGPKERIFFVVSEIGGGEIEWTLGAFLTKIGAQLVPYPEVEENTEL